LGWTRQYRFEQTATAGAKYGPEGWLGGKIYLANDDVSTDQVFTISTAHGPMTITLKAGESVDEEIDSIQYVSVSQAIAIRIWIFGGWIA